MTELLARASTELDDAAIETFLDDGSGVMPVPAWGPIGEEVFRRTYSRQDESWADTVKRVVIGNLSYAPPDTQLPNERIDLFRLIYTFGALPAGRHLWVTGTSAAQFNRNCWVSGWSGRLSDHFRFLSNRLFEGGGVGSNYSSDLIAMANKVIGTVDVKIQCRYDHPDIDDIEKEVGAALNSDTTGYEIFSVEDTREGWVEAWCKLIDTATTQGSHALCFDLSGIRRYGAHLNRFGGTASGPAPLAKSLQQVAGILSGVAVEQRQLTGIEAMEIDHELACAIVAGGARRSARIALMTWTDEQIYDFIHVKNNPISHWTTNISVEIDDEFVRAVNDRSNPLHARARGVLLEVATGMATNGEPGLMNSSLHSVGEPVAVRYTNPCGEASLTTTDNALGESCNLGSVNLDHFGSDIQAAREAFRLMARFLYRATLSDHDDPSINTIERRNRRIGVGFFGLQGWCVAHGYKLTELPDIPELESALVSFRKAAREAADTLAEALGTPKPVKVTAIAPTGTIAQLCGTTAGVHPVFAKRFIRRVRFSDCDPILDSVKSAGYNVVPDVYAANTSVVEFLVKDSILDKHNEALIEESDEVSVADFFRIVTSVQHSFCADTDGQAVSATGHIHADVSPQSLVDTLIPFLNKLKGVTVFPRLSRPLAPYEVLSESEYNERLATIGVVEVGDSNPGECIGGACPIR